MAKPWRLTKQAERSLSEIARWTSNTFGSRQAAAYQRDLLDFCELVAAGATHIRSCRDYLAPNVSPDLQFARFGTHLLIFVELNSELVITDFLHAQRDLPRLLAPD